jgi:hypothetical protein
VQWLTVDPTCSRQETYSSTSAAEAPMQNQDAGRLAKPCVCIQAMQLPSEAVVQACVAVPVVLQAVLECFKHCSCPYKQWYNLTSLCASTACTSDSFGTRACQIVQLLVRAAALLDGRHRTLQREYVQVIERGATQIYIPFPWCCPPAVQLPVQSGKPSCLYCLLPGCTACPWQCQGRRS